MHKTLRSAKIVLVLLQPPIYREGALLGVETPPAGRKEGRGVEQKPTHGAKMWTRHAELETREGATIYTRQKEINHGLRFCLSPCFPTQKGTLVGKGHNFCILIVSYVCSAIKLDYEAYSVY